LIAGVVTWWALQPPEAELVARAETSMATVETGDGSTVRLRPNSELYRVEVAETGTARYRLEGEALFDVVTDPNRSFEVQANGAVVRVLGTRFTVRTWTPDPEVYLEEGRVELRRPADGSPVILQPGQRGIVRSATIDVDEASATAYLDWTERRLTIDARSAAQVAAELGHHFNVQVSLPDSVADQTVTGRLLLDDRRQALRDFGTVLGGRFVDAGDRTFVFRPESAPGR
jgi:ferric-dicitrate binding protein FerR (iron transport regulator)